VRAKGYQAGSPSRTQYYSAASERHWHRSKLPAQDTGKKRYSCDYRTVIRDVLLGVLAVPDQGSPFRSWHDYLATNLNRVRLIRNQLFVARQRNGLANLLRNVAASTTPKLRADICISRSSLRNSTLTNSTLF
jgi:hypothetical protein